MSRGSHYHVSEFSSIVHSREIHFIEKLFNCVGQEERLFKVRLEVVLQNFSIDFASAIFVNVLQDIGIDSSNFEFMLSTVERDVTGIAGEMHIF